MMNNNEFFNPYIKKVRQYPRVYKYLTYESGIKMLKYNNLQFTRADYLNDGIDCHISKVDFDFVVNVANAIKVDPCELVSQVIDKHEKAISSFGICSLGTSPSNSVLWERYTQSDGLSNGICIELDLNTTYNCLIKKNLKVVPLVVNYVKSTNKSIPYKYFTGIKMKCAQR